MKFWSRLRWIASLVFVALLLGSWLAAETTGAPGTTSRSGEIGRSAPVIPL